jgi:hypothetical protein
MYLRFPPGSTGAATLGGNTCYGKNTRNSNENVASGIEIVRQSHSEKTVTLFLFYLLDVAVQVLQVFRFDSRCI